MCALLGKANLLLPSLSVLDFRRIQNTKRICTNAIVSQPSKCLKFMTFREGCFVIRVEYRYLSETLETFYYHQFHKKRNKIVSVN